MLAERPEHCLIIDIEATPASANQDSQVFKIGAFRPDTGASLEGSTRDPQVWLELERLTQGADYVLGHNIAAHDLPLLQANWPRLALLQLPAIDTLLLSPLAFPQNPYHRLLKDYKLVRDSLNSPLADCRCTWDLYLDQLQAFRRLAQTHPQELLCYQALLAPVPSEGLGQFFQGLTRRSALSRATAGLHLPQLLLENDPSLSRRSKVCSQRLEQLAQDDCLRPEMGWPIAYALAWLRVSGGNSVLPPWVRHQYPQVVQLITELRDTPCGHPDCGYCASTHDPRHELQRYFGFEDFRYEQPGQSAQRDVVLAGMRSRSVLAVLATGGGKSLCYQLPALNRFHRNGSLTVIISPLQSLMKDQVDGLLARNVQCAAALNGLLTLPERADVLERIQMGDIGLLLVSPEQFRNTAFARAIAQRQVGAWIYDEAHCLSKWGNDFRPDYLYVAKFIRQHYPSSQATVGCFTATAKQDVLADIRQHFQETLGIRFTECIGTPDRPNLSFEVYPVDKPEKNQRTQLLMADALEGTTGGCVVFVSSRKRAEETAHFLAEQGWRCKHFHAGLLPNEKKDIQDAFIRGDLQAIVATNAFGMGVDKQNVRLVIHADIPGSLENYLQEAGRAGRDQQAARCVLLYCAEDIESQFGLSERSQLSQRDIQQILKKLRAEAKRRPQSSLVITAGEILNDQLVQTSFSQEDRDADTKVITALAWLERGAYLQRAENHTRIFPARPCLPQAEAQRQLAEAGMSRRREAELQAILSHIYRARADASISTDQLMQLTGLTSEEVGMALKQLETLGLLENDTQLTLYVRSGVRDASVSRLNQSCTLESALFEILGEQAASSDLHEWTDLHLPALTQALRSRCALPDLLPMHVNRLLRSIAQDRDGDSQNRSPLELRQITRDHLKLRLRDSSWRLVQELSELRRKIAQVLLRSLLDKLPPGLVGKDLLIQTTLGELHACLAADLDLNALVKLEKRQTAIQHVLLYLHMQEIVQLNHGMTVMRRAMNIAINPDKHNQRYLKNDYQQLEDHYQQRRIQIHVMREYAESGLQQMGKALQLVLDYFSLEQADFLQRYFRGKAEMLKLATSEASWKKITAGLNPQQLKIVTDDSDQNRLILAGPGSGKTRVVVHRIAYLLRVRRVPASAIIALTFNRHAAAEIRQRLFDLIGNDAIGITVFTYHAMAMRLTGTSFNRRDGIRQNELEDLLEQAAELLEGKRFQSDEGEDDMREHLLQGYRYILVDEYQDIDARQYRMVSALSKRQGGGEDRDGDLCILGVGDDDQNIYAFRGGSNSHIQDFREEFSAEIDYLVENYRSSAAIVEASNRLISHNPQRLKADYPIRVDRQRQDLPAGGRWQALDPKVQGRVLRLQLPDSDRSSGNLQAQAAIALLQRWQKLDPQSAWTGCAVLSRSHQYLEPLQAWCEQHQVPYSLASNKERSLPLTRQRGFLAVIHAIQQNGESALTVAELQQLLGRLDLAGQWESWFRLALVQLHGEFGDSLLGRQTLVDWLYELARELRQQPTPGLFLGTVHAAKGLEFQHVVLLDGDWQLADAEEERRLYYVGMTRAKETLALCEWGQGHLLSRDLHHVAKPVCCNYQHQPALQTRYQNLGLQQVDLGFAGRYALQAPVHAAIASLRPGDRLNFQFEQGVWKLFDRHGQLVGRTAKSLTLNLTPQHCEVVELITRYASDSEEAYQQQLKSEQWEVVLPRFWG